MKNMIKLAVVDDQCLFRSGLISLINELDGLDVIIESSDGKELISEIEKQRPDVILLDIEMPGMDGFETTEYLKKNYPDIKILILTMYDDEDIILRLIESGAHGFLLKNDSIETIAEAIHSVMECGYYFNKNVPRSMVKQLLGNKKIKASQENGMSKREIEVMKFICRAYTNKEIADNMFISVRTVDGHRTRILEKTKARNTAGIVMYALKNGFFTFVKNKRIM